MTVGLLISNPDLAPAAELVLAQALTADERARAVADDRSDVQRGSTSAAALQSPSLAALDAADDPDPHALGGALLDAS